MSRSPALSSPIDVLICDDSEPLRVLLSITLGDDPDLRVAGEARNGREAIDEAKKLQPDVVLLDLSMPVMTGLDALPAIKLAAPDARIIAFTGLSGSVVKEALMAAGVEDFVEKGAHPDVIVATIKRVAHDLKNARYAQPRRPMQTDERTGTRGKSLIDGVLAVVFSKR
jgi:DNA-binding NarL/FixJ family response regulator